MRIVFVCYGNLCRSPMAEAVFRWMVEEAGLADEFSIDSCGTSDWHAGETPCWGTMKVLKKHGIGDYHHRSRPLSPDDLEEADYLLAMDEQNLEDIQKLGKPRGKLARILDFAPQIDVRNVPDPYYDETEVAYETVYRLVDLGCRGLLAHILQERGEA